jgi:hypothetical protein
LRLVREVIRITPPGPSAEALHQALGALARGRDPEALGLAREAVARDGASALVHAVLGHVAVLTHHPFTAAQALRDALQRDPGLDLLHRDLAWALRATHRLAESREHLLTYLQAQPHDWSAARQAHLVEVDLEVRASFVEVDAPDFPVVHDPGVPRARVEEVVGELRGARPRVEALLGPLREPVGVVIYRERADMFAGKCVSWDMTALYDGALRLHDGLGAPGREARRRRVAAHELTHAAHARNGGRRDGWLEEGVAMHVAGDDEVAYGHALAAVAREGTYIPLGSMMGTMALDTHADTSLAYLQGWMMVRWVVDRTGEEGLARLVHAREPDGLAALAAALGEDKERLGPAFLAWARSRVGR